MAEVFICVDNQAPFPMVYKDFKYQDCIGKLIEIDNKVYEILDCIIGKDGRHGKWHDTAFQLQVTRCMPNFTN